MKLPAIPLITCDPYFSYRSFSRKLNSSKIKHRTGKEKEALGTIEIDGKIYRFLGKGSEEKIEQSDVEVSYLFTKYTFKKDDVILRVNFWNPLLLDEPKIFSRPVTFVDFSVESELNIKHEISIKLKLGADFTYDDKKTSSTMGDSAIDGKYKYSWIGKREQPVLSQCGDNLRINWGYLYLTGIGENIKTNCIHEDREAVAIEIEDSINLNGSIATTTFAISYDDIYSINYYGDFLKGYRAKDGLSFIAMLFETIDQREKLFEKCQILDDKLAKSASSTGKYYRYITKASYRQAVAAHKLVADKDGDIVFISKENFSNGCAATVDVSYPSSPLFLLFNPELVNGMLRPIFKFARLPVREYDFSPHDAGRYPYLVGNVYGIDPSFAIQMPKNNELFPAIYNYPKGSRVFDLRYQMPVEECGNDLIMVAAGMLKSGDTSFAIINLDLLEKYVTYLVKFGEDPGDQLCTDDFAGHLAHNVNLAIKATLGIEAYSIILSKLDKEEESEKYHLIAKKMADSIVSRSHLEDHTSLVFGSEEGWSLKYNLIWDRFFKSNLFDHKLFEEEVDRYIAKSNEFGVALDSRKDYTKSDRLVWTAAFIDDKKKRETLIKPLYNFLVNSPDKAPFSDRYDTVTGKIVGFRARSVIGGVFMPMLIDNSIKK
jgi:hypothetical protein